MLVEHLKPSLYSCFYLFLAHAGGSNTAGPYNTPFPNPNQKSIKNKKHPPSWLSTKKSIKRGLSTQQAK